MCAASPTSRTVVIAIDGVKVIPDSIEKVLARKHRGDSVRVHAFRRDELIVRSLKLGATELNVKLRRNAP